MINDSLSLNELFIQLNVKNKNNILIDKMIVINIICLNKLYSIINKD
jgi:hypothetical protein